MFPKNERKKQFFPLLGSFFAMFLCTKIFALFFSQAFAFARKSFDQWFMWIQNATLKTVVGSFCSAFYSWKWPSAPTEKKEEKNVNSKH